ncbi:peroxisomal membrane protein pex16 [Rhodotorula toruloides]|uniref:Peroxisomal membrane protein PEX16 n=1 Tax=Rhodotorula toruloides TaxID=5286 RepID=A0A511KG11_RHOTO|nr:peroxisomal membrane protein pex16 [Rhodotorula toruloides]
MTVSGALQHYEAGLVANASRIASIESTLRTLTWFLPGRFQDAEVASEGLYSVLNLISLYHDSILHRAVSSLPAPLRPPSSSHTRYTRHFTTHSKPYNLLAHSLSVVQSLELLLEMVARKKSGRQGAEKTVVAIEALKALLRLGLMSATQGRTGVQPPVAEREVDPALLELNRERLARVRQAAQKNGDEVTAAPKPQSAADVLLREANGGTDLELGMVQAEVEESEFWTGTRTGYVRPTLASLRRDGGDAADPLAQFGGGEGARTKDVGKEYLMSRVLTVEDVKRPQDLVEKAKGIKRLAEIIWILRPLIYVLAMRKYGRRHTLPYLLSLSLEYLAFSLRSSSTSRLASDKASGPMLPHATPSELERQETSKRGKMFWWYLLRGPVWESWTKPQLEGMARRFEDKPVIGFVATLLHDYVPLIDEYYYYTA